MLSEILKNAKAELAVVQRQAMVFHLYARKQKSVMVSCRPTALPLSLTQEKEIGSSRKFNTGCLAGYPTGSGP